MRLSARERGRTSKHVDGVVVGGRCETELALGDLAHHQPSLALRGRIEGLDVIDRDRVGRTKRIVLSSDGVDLAVDGAARLVAAPFHQFGDSAPRVGLGVVDLGLLERDGPVAGRPAAVRVVLWGPGSSFVNIFKVKVSKFCRYCRQVRYLSLELDDGKVTAITYHVRDRT